MFTRGWPQLSQLFQMVSWNGVALVIIHRWMFPNKNHPLLAWGTPWAMAHLSAVLHERVDPQMRLAHLEPRGPPRGLLPLAMSRKVDQPLKFTRKIVGGRSCEFMMEVQELLLGTKNLDSMDCFFRENRPETIGIFSWNPLGVLQFVAEIHWWSSNGYELVRNDLRKCRHS